MPDEYISLLKRYLKLAPYLVPASNRDTKTISHHDLHLDNIFVDTLTRRITCIIDWQFASVLPIALQRAFPQMLEPDENNKNSEGQQSDDNNNNNNNNNDNDTLAHYNNLLRASNPTRWAILNNSDKYLPTKTNPINLVPMCWERENIFRLRHSLISIVGIIFFPQQPHHPPPPHLTMTKHKQKNKHHLAS